MRAKIYAVAVAILLALAPVLVSAKDANPKKTELTEQQKIRLRQIITRIDEIKAIDKSSLNPQQRKQLRTELKAMKKEARAFDGIYLSAGAIIIILLVLILIT